MKIFVLLPRIPWPLEKGDKLRAYNQIKQLARNNEIVLCALNVDGNADKQKAFSMLQPYCVSVNFIDITKVSVLFNIIIAFFTGKPLQCGFYFSRNAKRKIHSLIKKHQPEMLYCQFIRVAPYIIKENLPKTIDYQDVLSIGMKRRADIAPFYLKPFFLTEYKRLRRYENYVFDLFDVKTIISEQDRDFIDHPEKDKIVIVPNGVDHDFFKPQNRKKIYDVVFTGNMAYPPNVNAVEYLAEEILPLVWKSLPDVKMFIAGATPDGKVRRVASDKIIVSGWIDDIRDAYSQSRVFIAPMRIGTGLQNKILEAMSMKIPSITTSLASNPIGATEDVDIMVGNNAAELASHIVLLLKDKEKAASLAQNGYDFVHRVYEWSSVTSILEEAMKKVIKK